MDEFREWAARLRASDVTACAEVFDATHTQLLRYAIRLTLDEDAAQDIVQETFIKLWLGREKLDPDRSVKALLYTIVRNLSFNRRRDQLREHDRRVSFAESAPREQPALDDEIEAEELSIQLRKWIEELPPRRREAFELSRFDDLGHEAIAEIMDLTTRTVTNHIMLALQHVRGRLEQYRASGVEP